MEVPRVIIMDLPYDIKGYTVQNMEGEQVIVLNARYNHEANIKSFWHEIKHENDFGDVDNISELEYIRHIG